MFLGRDASLVVGNILASRKAYLSENRLPNNPAPDIQRKDYVFELADAPIAKNELTVLYGTVLHCNIHKMCPSPHTRLTRCKYKLVNHSSISTI